MVSNRELKNEILQLQHQVAVMIGRMDAAVVVSSPDSPMAASAYNGLRKTVIQSLQATQVLQAAIAQLDSVAEATTDVEVVRAKISELMMQYGIRKLDDYDERPDAFERLGQGIAYRVTRPAYVASPEMPAIQMGVAEAVEGSQTPIDAERPTDDDHQMHGDHRSDVTPAAQEGMTSTGDAE